MSTRSRRAALQAGAPIRLLVAVTDPLSMLLLRGQLAAARRAGFEVELLCGPGELATRLAADEGVTHVPIPLERRSRVGRDVLALWRLLVEIRRFRPDVVDASTPKTGLLAMVASWLLRVPARVHTLRGLRFETMTGTGRVVVHRLTWLTCRLAHRVVCISASLRERAVEEGVVDPARSTVHGAGSSNGLDESRFSPTPERLEAGAVLRRELGVPAGACLVGFVGRLARDKGVVDLLEAWAKVRDEHPDLHLLVVGPEDTTDPVPRDALHRMTADPRCHAAGHLDDVAPAYAAIDVLVLPTYREGFGNVLIEAAAMERPVVATAVTGCVDAVEDGVTGTLVPAHDPGSLAEAIAAYARDPELRRRHGVAGAARARRLYRQQDLWDRMHDEYRRLLGVAS